MDPINERKVFEMMVNLLSGETFGPGKSKNLGCTQYFMLTPKLLPDLKFNRRMKVFIIHNGAEMVSGRQWNLKNIINARKALADED